MSRGKAIHPETESKKSAESPGYPLGKQVYVTIEKDRFIRVVLSGPNYDNGSAVSLLSIATTDENNVENTHKHVDIVIFLIHGVGGSGNLWGHQINFLKHKGYTIVSPDLLGHGVSSKPMNLEAYEFEEIAKDMLYIFDKFKGKRNVLVGHSYGASFVTLIAKERGHFISKIILISGGAPTPLKPEKNTPFCLPMPLFACLKPIIIRKYRRMAFHRLVNEDVTFSVPSFVLKATMQGQNWPEGGDEYHSDLLVPVLLIYGRNDKFVTLQEEQWMQETIYGAQLDVVEDAGHMVMLERPDVVNEMILKFLNRDPSTRSRVELSEELRSQCWTSPIDNEEKTAVSGEKEEESIEVSESLDHISPRRTVISRVSRRGSSNLSKRSKVML